MTGDKKTIAKRKTLPNGQSVLDGSVSLGGRDVPTSNTVEPQLASPSDLAQSVSEPYTKELKKFRVKVKKCKDRECRVTDKDSILEDSGYCFAHAEELACILADASKEFGVTIDVAAIAYGRKPSVGSTGSPIESVVESIGTKTQSIEVTLKWCAFEESMIAHPHPTRIGNASFTFELDPEKYKGISDDSDLCERLFKETNLYQGDIWYSIAEDIPDNRSHTALSVGDEITIKRGDGEAITYSCADLGFKVSPPR